MRANLLRHTAKVFRREKIEGQGLTSQWVEKGEVKCLLLPVNEKDAITQGMTFGKQYQLSADIDADIQEGDKLVVSVGETVLVNGKAVYNTSPVSSHIECSCTTED